MYLTEGKTSVSTPSLLPVSNTHQLHWLVTAAGLYQISVQNSADQSLFRVYDVSVRHASVCASASIVTGPGIKGAVANQIMTLTVIVRDQYGNVVDVAS
jgi:hypothetical protein